MKFLIVKPSPFPIHDYTRLYFKYNICYPLPTSTVIRYLQTNALQQRKIFKPHARTYTKFIFDEQSAVTSFEDRIVQIIDPEHWNTDTITPYIITSFELPFIRSCRQMFTFVAAFLQSLSPNSPAFASLDFLTDYFLT